MALSFIKIFSYLLKILRWSPCFPLIAIATLLSLNGCIPAEAPADLVLLNGKIVTLDSEQAQIVEALAVRGDRIVALGSNEDITPLVTDQTRVLDVDGHLVTPGWIESHAHFRGIGSAQLNLDLTRTSSWEEIVQLVGQKARQVAPGQWIVGRGWHQEKWEQRPEENIQGLPRHEELSQVSPDHPVMLEHASGHACLANARAMSLAGIAEHTESPPGGEIVRDDNGNPIGVFRENAQELITSAYATSMAERTAEESRQQERKLVELAASECLSKGITTLHDAGASFELVDLLKSMAEEQDLPLRLYVMLGESNDRLAERIDEYRLVNYGGHHLTVRSIKKFIDGALGSHGAWLTQPYTDLPSSSGLNVTPISDLRRTAEIALEHNFQLCTHAIGDRGNHEVLDLYESVAPDSRQLDLRWRIEHAQHLLTEDISRFLSLGVVAAMQAVHATSDGPWVIQRLGEKRARQGAYVWRSLLDAGALVCNGTDAPVEDVNPVASFHASVTRLMKNGSSFFPEQSMTRLEALRSYTVSGAYAAFEELDKGTLAPGKLADVTIFSRDLMTIPAADIPGAQVLYTIVGGEIRYRRSGMKMPVVKRESRSEEE